MSDENKALAVQQPSTGMLAQVKWNDEDKALMRQTVARDLTEPEFKLFMIAAHLRNLNPLPPNPQVFPVKYKGRMVLQTSIDGYRAISARKGNDGGVHNRRLRVATKDGQKLTIPHSEYDPEEHVRIISGTVEVRFTDDRDPQEATAVFSSYAKWFKGDNGKEYLGDTWRNMPDVMILKCAEAQARRMACPNDYQGLYVHEEMDQARAEIDAVDVEFTRVNESPEATDAQAPEGTGSVAGKGRAKREPKKRTPVEPQPPADNEPPHPAEEASSGEPQQAGAPQEPSTATKEGTLFPGDEGKADEGTGITNPEVLKFMSAVWNYFDTLNITPEGRAFAEKQLCSKFAAEKWDQIPDEDIDALRWYCRDGLIAELEAEGHIKRKPKE